MADGYSTGWLRNRGLPNMTYEEKKKEWRQRAIESTYAPYYKVIEEKNIGNVYETPILTLGRKYHYIKLEQRVKRTEDGDIIYYDDYRVNKEDQNKFSSLDKAKEYYDSFKPEAKEDLEKEFIYRLNEYETIYAFNYLSLSRRSSLDEISYKNTEQIHFIKELYKKGILKDLNISILQKHIDDFNNCNKPMLKEDMNKTNKDLVMTEVNLSTYYDSYYDTVNLYFDFDFEGVPFTYIISGDYDRNTVYKDIKVIPFCNMFKDYRYIKLEKFIKQLESNIVSNKKFLRRLYPKNTSYRFNWDKTLKYREEYYRYLEEKIKRVFNENKF